MKGLSLGFLGESKDKTKILIPRVKEVIDGVFLMVSINYVKSDGAPEVKELQEDLTYEVLAASESLERIKKYCFLSDERRI